jgi:hypothetical protein
MIRLRVIWFDAFMTITGKGGARIEPDTDCLGSVKSPSDLSSNTAGPKALGGWEWTTSADDDSHEAISDEVTEVDLSTVEIMMQNSSNRNWWSWSFHHGTMMCSMTTSPHKFQRGQDGNSVPMADDGSTANGIRQESADSSATEVKTYG